MADKDEERKSRFVKILRGISEKLEVDFAQISSQIEHRGTRGSLREKALIRELLSKYLPNRLGITRGEIICTNQEVSGECDAIIYDAAECPVLLTQEDYQIVPVEAVYGVIEVKSHLDSAALDETFEKFQKIKKLPKTAFQPVQSDRKWHFLAYDQQWDYFPIAGFLFAYRSINLETLAKHLQDLHKNSNPEQRIDLACVLDSGCIFDGDETRGRLTAGAATRVRITGVRAPLVFFMALVQNLMIGARTEPVLLNAYLGEGQF